MPSDLRICVLGPLRVLRDGVDVLPPGRRPRDLIAALAVGRQRAVPVEQLLDRVWAADAARLDGSAVHTVVARLRRAAGPELVETVANGYRFGREIPADDREFAGLVRRAGRLTDTGAGADAVPVLRAALDLWTGSTAYEGIDDEVIAAERTLLDDQRCAAEEGLASALLDSDADPGEVLAITAGLIVRQPFRERAYELAMLAAYRAGRAAHAGEIYRRLRRRLRDDLGADPGPRIGRLHQQILARDPALDGPTATSGAGAVRPGAAPAARHPILGRDREVRAVEQAIRDGRRLITLAGPGGVGKTRLLLEVAARAGHRRTVRYADLSGQSEATADELADATLRALGLNLPVGVPASEHLVAALADSSVLLLLDEAEWSVDACAVVVDGLLRGCPEVTVVVSSRRPLRTVGEHVLPVGPLSAPPDGADDRAVAGSPAVQLLTDRIRDHAPDFVVDAGVRHGLAAVARRVDGLPLALELAAGHAAFRSVDELGDLVREPLRLASADSGRTPRHRSLRATLGWTVDRLEPGQRQVLRRLGVFVGAFSAEAAAAVVGPGLPDVPAVVRALARDALLTVDHSGTDRLTFRMLRTVRDLALEDLDRAGELGQTRARHRRMLAARWRGALRRDDLLEDVARHHDDYVEALRTALEDGDGADAADLVLTLCRMWMFRESVAPGLRWTGEVLESGLLEPAAHARVLALRSSLQLFVEPGAARAGAEQALPVLLAHDDFGYVVGAHQTVALERCNAGDLDAARVSADLAVRAGRSSTPERLADALGVRAVVCSDAGLVEAARRDSDEAWSIVRDCGSAAALVSVACNLAHPLLESGQPATAADLMDAAAREMRRLPSFPVPRFITLNAGWSAVGCGRYRQALASFADTLDATGGDADQRAAETYAGAACAAIGIGHPLGGRLLAAAETLLDRVGLVLTPWEQSLLSAARAASPSGERRELDPTSSLGRHLRELLTEICRNDADPALPAPRIATEAVRLVET